MIICSVSNCIFTVREGIDFLIQYLFCLSSTFQLTGGGGGGACKCYKNFELRPLKFLGLETGWKDRNKSRLNMTNKIALKMHFYHSLFPFILFVITNHFDINETKTISFYW